MNKNNTTFFGFKMPSNIPVEGNTDDPCQEVWDTGMRVEHIDLKDAMSVKSGQNCKLSLNGKLVSLKTTQLAIEHLLQELPIETKVPTEDGIYTWIVYSTETSEEKQFTASKILSSYEIGTKHTVIAYRVGAKRIYAAGELKIENGQRLYNVQSGTFMKPIFDARKSRSYSNDSNNLDRPRKRRRAYCYVEEFENFLITKLKFYFGSTSVYYDKTFIIDLHPSQEELDLYKKHGIVVELFDTSDQCRAYSNQVGGKRNVTRKRKSKKVQRRARTKSRLSS